MVVCGLAGAVVQRAGRHHGARLARPLRVDDLGTDDAKLSFNDVSYSWLIGILAGLGILILVGPAWIVITTSLMESMLDVRIASIAGGLILATPVLVIVMDWLIGLTKRMSL